MMVIELRQASKEKAFDLLEEMKSLGHEKKMVLCELEETLYDCFESSEEDEEYDNEYTPEDEMEYRRRKAYRYGNRRGMRGDMRDEDEEDVHSYHRGMRIRRRNRMGRFV